MDQTLININGDGIETLEILVSLTLISFLPSIVIMMSSFTRIVILLSFVRNALGIQQTPPNMVLVGIALFLTLFIMNPVITEVNETAYQPYKEDAITQEEALKLGAEPFKKWMLKQTEIKSLNMFVGFAGIEENTDPLDLPLTVVVPAFMTSELGRAFWMGFLLFLPFLLIDIIVASTLMSMGMIMLPPAMISLPFKLLLFIVVDGWGLLFTTIVKSFVPI